MICQICKSKVYKVHKVLKSIKVFECENCVLGFVNKKTILARSTQDGAEFYDYEEYKKIEPKLRKRFEKLTDEIVKFKKEGSVLDVGAGYGLFSSLLSYKGIYEYDIVEPNSNPHYFQNIKYRRYRLSFEEFVKLTKRRVRANLSKRDRFKPYDIIILMDVIEHFENPVKNLWELRKLLKEDGMLVIQTPNYKSLMARICTDWAWWMIEDHKFFFSPKSLQKMLAKTGFKREFLMTYEDWYDFRKNLDGNFVNLKNNILRKFIKGIFLVAFMPPYFLLRKLIWSLGYGGLLFTIAKKK